jgi:VanZ family protein
MQKKQKGLSALVQVLSLRALDFMPLITVKASQAKMRQNLNPAPWLKAASRIVQVVNLIEKEIVLKLFFKYWLPVVIYAVLIFKISSIQGPDLPENLILSDYILHALEYLPFGFLVCRAIKNTKNNLPIRRIFVLSFLFATLYAATDEFHQLFIPGRFASALDLLCDSIGIIIGTRAAI